MYVANWFTHKFMHDWEDTPADMWECNVAHFTTEFDKISRAEAQKAKHAGGDYGNAAALNRSHL